MLQFELQGRIRLLKQPRKGDPLRPPVTLESISRNELVLRAPVQYALNFQE
jgi:hypothetical protein